MYIMCAGNFKTGLKLTISITHSGRNVLVKGGFASLAKQYHTSHALAPSWLSVE